MKRLLISLLTVLMVMSLAACGSSNGTAPASESTVNASEAPAASAQKPEGPALIPDTEFPMPDTVLDIPCTDYEITDAPTDSGYDKKLVFTYEDNETARNAANMYYTAIVKRFNFKDSAGNTIGVVLGDDLKDDAVSFPVWIRYARETGEADTQALAGKYLLIEMTGNESVTPEFLASSWEDRSFYEYMIISEEGTVDLYAHHSDADELVGSYDLKDVYGQMTVEGDKITLDTLTFQRNDEVPDPVK